MRNLGPLACGLHPVARVYPNPPLFAILFRQNPLRVVGSIYRVKKRGEKPKEFRTVGMMVAAGLEPATSCMRRCQAFIVINGGTLYLIFTGRWQEETFERNIKIQA